MKLFKNTKLISKISSPTNFPSGLCVVTQQGSYWIKDGKKYKLISERATKSWSFTEVLATEDAIGHMKLAGKLGFRDGTLIKNIADGKMYLISQNKKRHITTPDVFDQYGLDKTKIIEVGEAEVNMHETGDSL